MEEVHMGTDTFTGVMRVGDFYLFQDYFIDLPAYNNETFWLRFKMRKDLFMHLVQSICAFDPWFVQKRDVVREVGLSSLHECSTTLRMLAYRIHGDEYIWLDERTALEAMKKWIIAIRGFFGKTYCKKPTKVDLERQVPINTDAVSLECLQVLIALTRFGKIAQLLGRDNSKTKTGNASSYSKWWLINLHGFGTHSSVYLG
jgi:hypothetical protein